MRPVDVLLKYAEKNSITNYEIMSVPSEDIQVGDVITIQPACYDDLPRYAERVTTPVAPFECNGRLSGWVICGFVFDLDEEVEILREEIKNVKSTL